MIPLIGTVQNKQIMKTGDSWFWSPQISSSGDVTVSQTFYSNRILKSHKSRYFSNVSLQMSEKWITAKQKNLNSIPQKLSCSSLSLLISQQYSLIKLVHSKRFFYLLITEMRPKTTQSQQTLQLSSALTSQSVGLAEGAVEGEAAFQKLLVAVLLLTKNPILFIPGRHVY